MNSSLLIAMPIYLGIDPDTTEALYRVIYSRSIPFIRHTGCSQLDIARSELANIALAHSFERLVWIDSDIVFHPRDFDRLVNVAVHFDLDIVCADYPTKEAISRSTVVDFPREGIYDHPQRLSRVALADHVREIRRCGFGFCVVHRRVFEAVEQQGELQPALFGTRLDPAIPWFAPRWDREELRNGRPPVYLSEDYAFCERAGAAGMRIWCAESISIGHAGRHVFRKEK